MFCSCIFSFLLHFTQVCSGSWDCRINLWQTNELDKGGDVVSIKKRKKDKENEETQLQVQSLLGIWNIVGKMARNFQANPTFFFKTRF